MEIWKDVPQFEGKYQVSNLGRVKSLDRMRYLRAGVYGKHKGGLLIHNKSGRYETVSMIHKSGKKKTCLVHRLVANAFISNYENKQTVNHKDGNKSNNNADNLEWMSIEENNNHALSSGLNGFCGNKNYNSKIVLDTATGIFYECTREAAEAKGLNPNCIISSLNGRRPNKTSLIYA